MTFFALTGVGHLKPFYEGVRRVVLRFRTATTLTLLIAEGFLAGCAQSAPPAPALEQAPETAAPVPAGQFVPSVYRQFSQWKAACDKLPSNRELKWTLPPRELLPLRTFAEFKEVLDAYFRVAKASTLAQGDAWLEKAPVQPDFFNTAATYFLRPSIRFQPFVQRELVPPGTEIIVHGDLHGDIHSLVAWVEWLNKQGYLRDFTLTRPNVYLMFLGDYTDRGIYGMEVLYTMLRLKVENPDRVLLVRGNHEDVNLAARYGFIEEGRGKYGREFDGKSILRFYDFLPLVLYLGCGENALQCNHGGMEPGFDPRPLLDAPDGVQYQLLGPLRQQEFLHQNPEFKAQLPSKTRELMESSLLDFEPQTPTSPTVIGFMWNDFTVVRGEPDFDYDPGRAFVYGERTTKYILRQHSGTRRLQAVLRAHQHATILNGMMRRLKASDGIYRHWQENDSVGHLKANEPVLRRTLETGSERSIPPGSVWTFNVGPDSVYGHACDFSFDTFGVLTTAEDFANWRLRVVNQKIRK